MMSATPDAPIAEQLTDAAPKRPGLFRRLLRRPLALASLIFLLLVALAAVLAPWIAPYGPLATDLANTLSGPTAEHLLGTDSVGRDVLSRLIWGSGPALGPLLAAVLTSLVIGVPIGLLAVLSPTADRILKPIVDLVMSIPSLIVLFMVLATFDQSMYAAMIAMGALTAPNLMRIVRGAGMSVVGEPYIEAARVFGLGSFVIAFRHLLPRIAGPILVNLSLLAGSSLTAEVGINFLGLGVKLPEPSWGGLVADGALVMSVQPWLLLPSGLLVGLVILSLVLLGDGIRDATAEIWSQTGSESERSRRRSKKAAASGVTSRADRVEHDSADAASGSLLQVKGLSISFAGDGKSSVEVVSGVSFDIKQGETVGIVGESGCGKSVTGLAILGLLPGGAHVDGQVLLEGRDLQSMSSRARSSVRGSTIAFVAQNPIGSLDPLFTVGSQLSQAVRIHRKSGRREAARVAIELLEQVKINNPERVYDLYPHQISGGMAQRVAIAIALAGEPKLLIADEPTTALDVTVQHEVIVLLKSLQEQTGMAILIISHDWGVVSTICQRAVVMYAGQVVERSPISKIFSLPLHPYSAGLLAANPHFTPPGERLATIPGTVPPPGSWGTGCRFRARCPFATDECSKPIELVSVAPERSSRCIHIDELTKRVTENVG